MNRRKKQLYGGVLLVGALAMLMDRMMSGSAAAPETAQAGSHRSLSEMGVESASGPLVLVAATPFPAMSGGFGPTDAIRDVFDTTPAVREAMFGDAAREAMEARADGRPGAVSNETFAQTHRLRAVMIGQDLSFAIVDGKWLRVGDRLDDCELTEMTGTTATFHCPGGPAVLSVIGTSSNADVKK